MTIGRHAAVVVAFVLPPALCSDWPSELVSAQGDLSSSPQSSVELFLGGEQIPVDSGSDDNDDQPVGLLQGVVRTGPAGNPSCSCSPYLIGNGVCDDECFTEA